MATMQSIVLTAPGVVELEERDVPVAGPGEVLLRMRHGGVCGSDLASFRGLSAYVTYPRTLGHEFSAEVVTAPQNDLGIRAGQLVTANPYFNCGACYPCRRGVVNACVDNQTMGVQREGAFAEYFTMPIERVYPGGDIDARALALIEPFSISYHGVSRAEIRPGDRVLVFGAGAIGILAAVAAKSRGALAYITDISQEKVDNAVAQFDLDGGFVNDSPDALRAFVLATTDGDGFQATVEGTGYAPAFLDAVDATASTGTVVVIGVAKHGTDFNPTEAQRKELTIVGSRGATRADFDATMQLVRDGFVDLTRLISREFAASDAVDAIAALDRESAQITKLLIDFNEEK